MTTQTITKTQEAQEQEHPIILGDLDMSKYIHRLGSQEQVQIQTEITNLNEELARINEYINSANPLYDFEKQYINKITRKQREMLSQKERLEAHLNISRIFPEIDPSFLKMRHFLDHREMKVPLPIFVPYELEKTNKFEINFKLAESYSKGKLKLSFSSNNSLANYYIDSQILEGLDPKNYDNLKKYSNHPLSLECEFKGIIPQKTKQRINQAKQVFDSSQVYSELYLIAQTPLESWEEHRVIKDPLIIAKTNLQNSYLIDHFDTTLLEDYVIQEFTTGSLGGK
ncbi:MAG: hypothetical protein ACP5OG_04190 [Candidatus Nanoarchaeia archaeon]